MQISVPIYYCWSFPKEYFWHSCYLSMELCPADKVESARKLHGCYLQHNYGRSLFIVDRLWRHWFGCLSTEVRFFDVSEWNWSLAAGRLCVWWLLSCSRTSLWAICHCLRWSVSMFVVLAFYSVLPYASCSHVSAAKMHVCTWNKQAFMSNYSSSVV